MSSTSQWEVQIQGAPRDLEHLARHFTTPEIGIFKGVENGGYVIRCSDFAASVSSEEVLSAAEDQLNVLSGVLRFAWNSRESLRAGAVYRIRPDGLRDIFVHQREPLENLNDFLEATATAMNVNRNPVQQPASPARTVKIAAGAASDPAIAKAMRLLVASDANNWVGLYRLHEVIQGDVGGKQAILNRSWGSPSDYERFKRSANSVATAGDGARHGDESTQPPSKPMTIDEAIAYVNCILHAWLASKGA